MGDLKTVENLLHRVSDTSKKYEEISKLAGENFNIFQILNIAESEVRLHSTFIAELLSPDGSHGLSHIFLKLFVEQVKFSEFNYIDAKVHIEHYIGSLNDDCTEGGRIDLIIDDSKGHCIIIENKIYAPDQTNQLLRYYNYGAKRFQNGCFRLYYLTLNRRDAVEKITTKNNEVLEVKSLGYSTEIKTWLENCHKETSQYPIIRETIRQYIILINQLTGQAMNHKMENELSELMARTRENVKAAFQISSGIDQMKTELMKLLQGQLRKVIKDIPHFSSETEHDGSFGIDKESTIGFYVTNSEDPYLKIELGFENFRNMFSISVGGEVEQKFMHEGKKVNLIKRKELKAKISKSITSFNRIGKDSCNEENFNEYYFVHYYENDLGNWQGNAYIWEQIPDGTLVRRLKEEILKVLEGLREAHVFSAPVSM